MTARPKKSKSFNVRPLDVIVLSTAIALILFGVWNILARQAAAPCSQPGQEHQLSVKDDVFNQASLTVKQCDVIKIANLDKTQSYRLAFGVHEQHIQYPGFTEPTVGPNEFIVIDAVKTGHYRMHDHLRDKASIEFTIEPK